MLIQSSTLVLLLMAFLIFSFGIGARKGFARYVCLFGALLCVRFGYLQFQWIEMALQETMRKGFEWNSHDVAVSGFMLLVSFYVGLKEFRE